MWAELFMSTMFKGLPADEWQYFKKPLIVYLHYILIITILNSGAQGLVLPARPDAGEPGVHTGQQQRQLLHQGEGSGSALLIMYAFSCSSFQSSIVVSVAKDVAI